MDIYLHDVPEMEVLLMSGQLTSSRYVLTRHTKLQQLFHTQMKSHICFLLLSASV